MSTVKTVKATTVRVVREGKQIVVPEDMSLKDARDWLMKIETEENTEVRVREEVRGVFAFDGARAFAMAIESVCGFMHLAGETTFFGPIPCQTLGVETGVDEVTQVPWGVFQVPNIDGKLATGLGERDGIPILVIGGVVKRKSMPIVERIVEETRKFARERSIYRGKAIRVRFPVVKDGEELDPTKMPHFVDLRKVKREALVFTRTVEEQIETSLFTPIEFSEATKRACGTLKRGVLFAGTYGTGKTQTAYVTAKLCEDNGWTFVMLEDASQLAQGLVFAQQYAPCVLFVEDIDSVLSGERDEDFNDMVNMLDGIVSKDKDVVVVFTTNHLERINPVSLRPGRIDHVIEIAPPNAEAAERLVRLYAGRSLSGAASSEEMAAVGKLLEGKIPAMIREVVERSKLAAVRRQRGEGVPKILPDDLRIAAMGINAHLALIETRVPDTRSPVEKAAAVDADGRRDAASILAGAVLMARRSPKVETGPRVGNGNGALHGRAVDDGPQAALPLTEALDSE